MLRKSLASVVLTGALALGGCSDGIDLEGELNADEAAALAEVLFAQTYSSTQSQADGSADAMGGVPYGPITAPCPLGGSVEISGDIESTQGEVTTIDYTVTQVHDDCQVRADRIDRVFTLNGDPNVSLDYTWVFGPEGGVEVDGGMNGSVQWETDGRGGTCALAVEFTFNGSFSEGGGSGSVTGSVCGIGVSQETTIG